MIKIYEQGSKQAQYVSIKKYISIITVDYNNNNNNNNNKDFILRENPFDNVNLPWGPQTERVL